MTGFLNNKLGWFLWKKTQHQKAIQEYLPLFKHVQMQDTTLDVQM